MHQVHGKPTENLNTPHLVNNFQSTSTLCHESDVLDGSVSDICSYSINSGSIKDKESFPIGDYFALNINDIGIVFVATVHRQNSLSCYAWTKYGSLVIPNLSTEETSQNYLLQLVLEHYFNIKDISRMLKQCVPIFDRADYESEIKHLITTAIKNVLVIRDGRMIQLLRKYQDAMRSCYHLTVDVIIKKEVLEYTPFEDLINLLGLNECSFQNYPFGSTSSLFLDSLGISSYKAPRRVESKQKISQHSKALWIHELNSLIDTEKSYLKSLKSLQNHYYHYLRDTLEKFSYDHICIDLNDLIELSEELVIEIEKVAQGDLYSVLNVFDNYLYKMKQPFSNFILKSNAAKLFIKPMHEKAFDECARLFGAPFNSHFSAPLQRITRYPMSLEQIARSLDSSDSTLREMAERVAAKSRKIASEIDSYYCRELNRGFSRDLGNKLKISGKVVNAKHQFVSEFDVQFLKGKNIIDHVLLILNHILILVPKTNRITTPHNQILSEKEIEKHYDLKHTIVLELPKIIIMESLLENDDDSNAARILSSTNQPVSFQISEFVNDSSHRHYFLRAKNVSEKTRIVELTNRFIAYSKFPNRDHLYYSEYSDFSIVYNFREEGNAALKDAASDFLFYVCKDAELDKSNYEALSKRYSYIGFLKIADNKLTSIPINDETGLEEFSFDLKYFFESMNSKVKYLVENRVLFHGLSYLRCKAEAYLDLYYSMLKSTEIPRTKSAFSILSHKSNSSQKTSRSSLLDFTKKITNLVRTPSIKRHARGATANSELWPHPTHESNVTPRKLGLPKNRAESFFMRPKNVLRLGRKTEGHGDFNMFDVLRFLIGLIEKEDCKYIYENTKLSGKSSVKEAEKIIENFPGAWSGLKKFDPNDLAKILVTLVTDGRMQKYLLPSATKSCILNACKEEPNDSELIPYIREFLSELPVSNKRCLHLLLNHWKRIADSSKYMIDLSIMADRLSIFISNEAVDFQYATLALECMIFYADTLFGEIEKMHFTYSDITLLAADAVPGSDQNTSFVSSEIQPSDSTNIIFPDLCEDAQSLKRQSFEENISSQPLNYSEQNDVNILTSRCASKKSDQASRSINSGNGIESTVEKSAYIAKSISSSRSQELESSNACESNLKASLKEESIDRLIDEIIRDAMIENKIYLKVENEQAVEELSQRDEIIFTNDCLLAKMENEENTVTDECHRVDLDTKSLENLGKSSVANVDVTEAIDSDMNLDSPDVPNISMNNGSRESDNEYMKYDDTGYLKNYYLEESALDSTDLKCPNFDDSCNDDAFKIYDSYDQEDSRKSDEKSLADNFIDKEIQNTIHDADAKYVEDVSNLDDKSLEESLIPDKEREEDALFIDKEKEEDGSRLKEPENLEESILDIPNDLPDEENGQKDERTCEYTNQTAKDTDQLLINDNSEHESLESSHQDEHIFSFDQALKEDKGTPPFEDALEYQDHGLLSLETSQLDLEAECIQGLALLKKRSNETQD